jgi:hypothetical protein
VIYAELLDRRGGVAHRIRIDRFPFRVGRAYSSDLIVDDPHVAADQLVIDETPDGGVIARDLTAPERAAMLSAAGELLLPVGRTRLRLRDRDFAVAPALPLVQRRPFLEWLFEHWSSPIAVFALQALLALVWIHQSSWRKTNLAEPLTTVLFTLLAVGAWSGGWALVTRFLRQRGRFPAHVAVAGLVMIASQLVDEAIQVGRFVIESIAVIQWTDLLTTAALAALLLYGHLRVAGVGSGRTRALIGLMGGALLLGIQTLQMQEAQPDWVSDLPYWSRLEPLPVSWLPRESVDEFFAHTQGMDQDLEELAQEE